MSNKNVYITARVHFEAKKQALMDDQSLGELVEQAIIAEIKRRRAATDTKQGDMLDECPPREAAREDS